MSKQTKHEYHCDKCGKKLASCNNVVEILTSLRENGFWSRLHVRIVHRHGLHNDAHEESADLCQSCAIKILEDALKRVKKGERMSAGIRDITMETWEPRR